MSASVKIHHELVGGDGVGDGRVELIFTAGSTVAIRAAVLKTNCDPWVL